MPKNKKTVIFLILALTVWSIFIYVINQVNYPQSLTQASPLQLIAFFLPLLLALTFSLRIVIKSLSISGVIAFILIILLILKALSLLNLATLLLSLVIGGLLISVIKSYKPRLTSKVSVPKLTNIRKVTFK